MMEGGVPGDMRAKVLDSTSVSSKSSRTIMFTSGGARGVMVIVEENGHGDTSSNPGRDWLHIT